MFLKSKILSKFPEIIHGFTTRELGDDYSRIARELGVTESDFFTVRQVHSNQVLFLSDRSDGSDGSVEADAIVTNRANIFPAIRTADCVPILVYDPEHRAAGAIHAGWRGLVSGVIENAVCEMAVHFGTKPPKLLAALGPALCPGCFEIGPEVAEAFRKRFGDRLEPVSDPSKAESVTGSCTRRVLTITAGNGDRSFVDLRKGCEVALSDSGLNEKNLEFLPYCTACHRDLFYSFRKGDTDKRQLAFIGVRL